MDSKRAYQRIARFEPQDDCAAVKLPPYTKLHIRIFKRE